MDPLVTNRQVLEWLCICSIETIKQLKFYNVVITVTIITTQIVWMIASIVSMLNIISSNFEDALVASYQVIGMISYIYTIFVAFYLRQEILFIFQKLTDLFNACKNSITFQFHLTFTSLLFFNFLC